MASVLSHAKSILAGIPRRAARGLVTVYRYTFSPLVGFHCRHLPTCSAYADQALDRFGLWAGGWMTLARLLPLPSLGHLRPRSRARAPSGRCALVPPWRYARWRGTNSRFAQPRLPAIHAVLTCHFPWYMPVRAWRIRGFRPDVPGHAYLHS